MIKSSRKALLLLWTRVLHGKAGWLVQQRHRTWNKNLEAFGFKHFLVQYVVWKLMLMHHVNVAFYGLRVIEPYCTEGHSFFLSWLSDVSTNRALWERKVMASGFQYIWIGFRSDPASASGIGYLWERVYGWGHRLADQFRSTVCC